MYSWHPRMDPAYSVEPIVIPFNPQAMGNPLRMEASQWENHRRIVTIFDDTKHGHYGDIYIYKVIRL